MSLRIDPVLIESEPFEVAMGGYEVTVFKLVNKIDNRSLAPDLKFKDFLATSPAKDFSILASWNSVRDEADLTLEVLDHGSGEIKSLGPIHSIPTDLNWKTDSLVSFVVRVRPLMSQLETSSEYDLAKLTVVSLEKEKGDFKLTYIKYF